jgi:hypothetical protein
MFSQSTLIKLTLASVGLAVGGMAVSRLRQNGHYMGLLAAATALGKRKARRMMPRVYLAAGSMGGALIGARLALRGQHDRPDFDLQGGSPSRTKTA